MLLTTKLIRYLHGVFDKDVHAFTAFRVRHTATDFSWSIADRIMTGRSGGAELFSVPLEGKTIRALLEHLATMPGVTVIGTSTPEQIGLSACALMDGSGRQAESNGDHVKAYTSILWAYLDAVAVELVAAKAQIAEALRQMSVKTAEAEWLDEWGGYFGFPRENSESDQDYATRIIAEVLRPRGNNKAIEIGLRDKFGQESRVIDLTRYGDLFPGYNGSIGHNGLYQHNSNAVPYYGLFKIAIGYDLLGGSDISGYVQEVAKYVETMRDAGTHLDSVDLGGSLITDSVSVSQSESTSGVILTVRTYSGNHNHNGQISHVGPVSQALSLS